MRSTRFRREVRAIERAERERRQRVEKVLGDGRVICDRCHATLATYAEACAAPLAERCPGFEAVEAAGKGR
jgi:hypothetical protein